MRILLIEDDRDLVERIAAGLSEAHYMVDSAWDGETGLRMARHGPYGLVILDLVLPRRDGWSVCEALRVRRNPVPILILTGCSDVADRVRALEAGADDCLPKPFEFSELLARVRALLRRDRIHKAPVVRISDLEIDLLERRVRRDGAELMLTPREFSLLEALATNEGRTLTRKVIQERVWGDDESYSNTVSYHIASLRRKVDAEHPVKLIHTVYGVGYVLRGPDSAAEP